MNKVTIAQPQLELPRNLRSEQVVLGCLIEDGALVPGILASGLTAEHFSLSDHRRIFQAVLDLHQHNAAIDYISVAEQLGNSADDIALLASLTYGVVVQSSHALYHAKNVMKKAELRKVQEICEALALAAAEPNADPGLLVHLGIKRLQGVRP